MPHSVRRNLISPRKPPGSASCFTIFLPSSKNLKGGIALSPLHWSGCFWYLTSYLTLSHPLVCQNLKNMWQGSVKWGLIHSAKVTPKCLQLWGQHWHPALYLEKMYFQPLSHMIWYDTSKLFMHARTLQDRTYRLQWSRWKFGTNKKADIFTSAGNVQISGI